MILRWISLLALTVLAASGIQRPDTKTALRNLARLPRVEVRVSFDFDADRGFVAFRTSKDPTLALTDLRAKLIANPNDPRLILESAATRLDAGDQPASRRDLQRASEALRKRLDVEPGNTRLRLDLASALHGLGRQAETESILREAVKLNPRSVTNWIALSSFMEARAWEVASGLSNWKGRRPYSELCRAVLRLEPNTETADRAARYLDESLTAAQESARLDDESAPAQHRLAVAIAAQDCFDLLRRRLGGRDFSAPLVDTLVFSSRALPALEKASALEPENPTRLATVLLWRGLAEAADQRIPVSEFSKRSLWDALSQDGKHKLEAGLEELDHFSGSSAEGLAAQALGVLRFTLRNDFRGAADDLRNAIEFVPDSEQLWETLTATLIRAQDYFELVAVCEARVLVRSTPRNRLLLAKAHEKLGNFDRAESEITIALAANGNDFNSNLAMANILLRESTNDFVSPRVRQSLVAAERAIRGNATGQQLVDLALAQSIYHGLTDDLDRAREILKAALAYAKDHPEVTAALNAIGY